MNMHSAVEADISIPCKVIVGVSVASLGLDDAIAILQERIRSRRFTRVGFLNAHVSNIACADQRLMSALRDFLVLPDGVGVDIAARLLYGEAFPANLNGTDFVPALLAATAEPLTIGLLGAKPENVERAAAALAVRCPQHRVLVISDGFFSPLEEPAVLARAAEVRPDVLLVAMGVPKQEFFVAGRIGEEHATVTLAVGALFDFLSEAVPRAPGWVRRMRLEWLFRMLIEPGRLWRRYLLGNPVFLFHVLCQKLAGAWSRP